MKTKKWLKSRAYEDVRKDVGEAFFSLGRLEWSRHVAQAEVNKLDKEIDIVKKQIQNLSLEAEKAKDKPAEGEPPHAG